MIVRGGTGFRQALYIVLVRNWIAVALVLAVEAGAIGLHELIPGLQATAFSAGAIGVLAAVVGIFVAFRFNEAYGRWWEARILWGGIVNVSRSFARQVTTLISPERVASVGDPQRAAELHRELVYRHLAYVHALRRSLRRQPVLDEISGYLSAADLDELARLENVPTGILQQQGEQLAAVLGNDTPEQILVARFDDTLSKITDLQGGLERIKNTAFPDRVLVISRVLVWVVVVLVAVAFVEPGEFDFFEFVAILVIALSFLLVKKLGEELNDPFENRPNDTPMTALCRIIEIDLRRQLGEPEVPAKIEPVEGVLM